MSGYPAALPLPQSTPRSRGSRTTESRRRTPSSLFLDVVYEFGYRLDAGNQQMIPRAGAGDVEQVALGVIDLLQISVVTDRLDALLQGNDFVVAGHYDHGAELKTFGKVHGANRDVGAGGFDMLIENLECYACFPYGRPRTIQLCRGSDKHTEFVWKYPVFSTRCDPFADSLGLLAFILERANRWQRTIEHGDRIAPIFVVAINDQTLEVERNPRPPRLAFLTPEKLEALAVPASPQSVRCAN
jgi:hypothetical protein